MPIAPGSFAWVGTPSGLKRGAVLPASSAAFSWSGEESGSILSRRLPAASDFHIFGGQAAILRLTRYPKVRFMVVG